MADVELQIATPLAAPAARVWAEAVSERGINHELAPWLRMTMPRGLPAGATIEDAPVGEPLGRSWILLRGLVPVEWDELQLAERGPGMRFVERSRLATARSWCHEREVIATGPGTCEIADRVALELRAPLRPVRAVAARIVRALFEHRHRRLRERWGPAER